MSTKGGIWRSSSNNNGHTVGAKVGALIMPLGPIANAGFLVCIRAYCIQHNPHCVVPMRLQMDCSQSIHEHVSQHASPVTDGRSDFASVLIMQISAFSFPHFFHRTSSTSWMQLVTDMKSPHNSRLEVSYSTQYILVRFIQGLFKCHVLKWPVVHTCIRALSVFFVVVSFYLFQMHNV